MPVSIADNVSLPLPQAPNGPPGPMLQQAKTLFNLPNPESTTERAWRAYIQNRNGARKFPGFEVQEREFNWDDIVYVLEGIRKVIAKLENEMGVENMVLQRSFKMLGCTATFGENERPSEAVTHTRLYSPTRPAYIDVHLIYRHETGWNSCEWKYSLGVKAYTTPGSADYKPPILKKFEYMAPEKAYGVDRWRRLAYGFYEDSYAYEMIENKAFGLELHDVVNIYEAFWGTLEVLPDDADDAAKFARRRKLVDCVRLLFAAVGVDYEIAVKETEIDDSKVDSDRIWVLEGIQTNLWIAREVRKACGFQLADDPEKEEKARKDQLEDALRNETIDKDDYDDDDGDGDEDEDSEYFEGDGVL